MSSARAVIPWRFAGLGAVVVAALLAAGAALATTASAKPAADCQPFAGRPCLFPFPNNLLTRRDKTSHTGLRLNLPAAAMPRDVKGVRIATGPYDRNDGFSPGSVIVLHIHGLDNGPALRRTNPAPLTDMAQTFAKRAPIVVIDKATGQRQLIWAELDQQATSPAATDLMIHPGKDFTEGHTYVVALRNLRSASGRLIKAPKWFARLRDQGKLLKAERSQRARYKSIFRALKRAGIVRNKSLYEAWDFTVGSRQSLTGRMLAIRNNAFAQLGDTNLGDSVVQGRAPAFQVTGSAPVTPPTGVTLPTTLRSVTGTFQAPCYLLVCGDSAQPGFHYSSSKPDATPTQIPGNVATAEFECVIPATASPSNPARISLYGHGLFGSDQEVEATGVQMMAAEHNMVFCATNWWGFAKDDVSDDAAALQNLNLFPAVVDRFQQGVLNTLFLGRVMLNPQGFAVDPAFQAGGRPIIDTSGEYYDGNSEGGILGGMTTAVSPDFRRAVLGVTGMNYGGMLLERSTDFAAYKPFLFKQGYTDQSLHPWILDLALQIWDRGEPDGYAAQMTSHPLPDTPSHQVLMQIAYGDHQVSMYAAAVQARTIGASAYQPALDLSTNRRRDRNLFYGIPTIKAFPFNGSAIEVWDSGPGFVSPPPLGNVAPPETTTGDRRDPHGTVRVTPAAITQKSDFLQANGSVVNVCGGLPCRTSAYTP
jgi:hypothetical protein